MGQSLATEPSSQELVGGGRRVGTLRNRVRGIRKFLNFTSSTFKVDFLSSIDYYTAYLRMRVSEPCTQCALKQAHTCIVFLEEVTGIQKSERVTHTQFYEIIQKLRTSHVSPKQAPRLFVSILIALEKFIMKPDHTAYLRIYALWMLVQCWCSLRFSDHRGIRPSFVSIMGSSLTAQLTWSKTLGHDKPVRSRPLVVDLCCHLAEPLWMTTGWTLVVLSAVRPRLPDARTISSPHSLPAHGATP